MPQPRLALLLSLFAAMVMPSCKPQPLELQDVPIMGNAQWDAMGDTALLQADLAALKGQGIHDFVLTLPLEADSTGGRPRWPLAADALPAVARQVRAEGFSLHLVWLVANRKAAFPSGAVPHERWFPRFTALSDSLLLLAQPERLVVGTDLVELADEEEWCAWASALRQHHPGVKLSYGASLEDLDAATWTHCMDELALAWTPPADGNPFAYCRDHHHAAGLKAQELGLPILIFQTNLLGQEKADQFAARLRYWPAGTEINGLILNTLYSRTVFQDSTSYYGLAKEQACREAIDTYQAGRPLR